MGGVCTAWLMHGDGVRDRYIHSLNRLGEKEKFEPRRTRVQTNALDLGRKLALVNIISHAVLLLFN